MSDFCEGIFAVIGVFYLAREIEKTVEYFAYRRRRRHVAIERRLSGALPEAGP